MPGSQLEPWTLTTLAAVRGELKLTDSSEDLLVMQIINAGSRQFESATRRRLKARTYKPSGAAAGEVNLKLNGRDRLSFTTFLFPEWPLNTVTSVVIKDDLLRNAKTLDLATDLVFDPVLAELRLIDGDTWWWGLQNIEIVCNAGYTTTPEDLERALITHCTWLFKQKDRVLQGIQSVSFEGQTVSYFTGELLPEVKKVVDRYVRPLVCSSGSPPAYDASGMLV